MHTYLRGFLQAMQDHLFATINGLVGVPKGFVDDLVDNHNFILNIYPNLVWSKLSEISVHKYYIKFLIWHPVCIALEAGSKTTHYRIALFEGSKG